MTSLYHSRNTHQKLIPYHVYKYFQRVDTTEKSPRPFPKNQGVQTEFKTHSVRLAVLYKIYLPDYLATRSSHFTMNSITPIEMKHTIMKIAQQYPIGIALYIRGPIHNRRFVFTLKKDIQG